MKATGINIVRSPRLPDKRWAGLLRILGVGGAGGCLIASLWTATHWDWSEHLFLTGLGAWFVCELYWALGPSLTHFLTRHMGSSKDLPPGGEVQTGEAFQSNLYTPTNHFYRWRSQIRHGLQIFMILISWMMAYHLVLTLKASQSYLAMGFFLYSLIFIAWIAFGIVRDWGLGSNRGLWLVICVISGLAVWVIFQGVQKGIWQGVLMFLFGAAVTGIVYVTERIEVGDRVWAEVIRGLTMDLLSDDQTGMDWKKAAAQIGVRLGYERVFILLPSEEENCLNVEAEYGDYPNVIGKHIPMDKGITGEAYRTGRICASNDVNQCEVYERVIPDKSDDTKAEIAVPLIYRGETLGVLDVQSRHAMVYGPGDLNSMDVIGRILSLALATQSTDRLVEEGRNLWERISKSAYSESEIMKAVSQFAREKLQADLVVFYRLTPTGVPDGAPEVLGELWDKDKQPGPFFEETSPLFDLVRNWEPYYEETVEPGCRFQPRLPGVHGFAKREGIQSAFFIPIGTPDERLAAVFLNYRHHRPFNNLFRLMVAGFAQAFAAVMARERYRDFLFQGVGRPELGVHNILARYGLKDGVGQEIRKILNTEGQTGMPTSLKEDITRLTSEVDDCLIELRAQTSQIDASYNHSLREAVEEMTRRMKDHVPGNRSVRFAKNIDPRVERESAWTRLAIFRVIDEAVNNAIFHAGASEIWIHVSRDERTISVQVTNNGTRLPEDAIRRKSRRGIFSVLEELEDKFQAHFSLEARQNPQGTIVKVEIPALPRTEKESITP